MLVCVCVGVCVCVCAHACVRDLSSVSPTCSDLKLRVRILIDGTLIIFRVKPEDAGKYTCTPSNSLGISPSASAHLTVQCECNHSNKVAGEGQVNLWSREQQQQQRGARQQCSNA